MLAILRRNKSLAAAFALAAFLASSPASACAARKVWIENIMDGTVRLHIFYLVAEGDGVCIYQ